MKTTAEASIFIIEDDLHFRDTFIDVMSLRGVPVQGAGSGREGLELLKEARPAVIILDIKLPDMHGFDICRRIKRIEGLKKTPVVFVSSASHYNDSRDRVEGLLAGAALFLLKPITGERLWDEIEPLLERR